MVGQGTTESMIQGPSRDQGAKLCVLLLDVNKQGKALCHVSSGTGTCVLSLTQQFHL